MLRHFYYIPKQDPAYGPSLGVAKDALILLPYSVRPVSNYEYITELIVTGQ